MTSERFRRLVLELGQGAMDRAAIQAAARHARWLGVDLLALFVEDEALLHASALPFTREICAVTHRWRDWALDGLENDLRAAAERARRLVMEAARASGVTQTFEIRRGDPSAHMADVLSEADVVVAAAPRPAPAGLPRASRLAPVVARHAMAPVLWLPADTLPDHGPVAALVAGPEDACPPVARWLAARMEVDLALLGPEATHGSDTLAALTCAEAALGSMRARLIVVSAAGPWGALADELAARRKVPVLTVG